MASPTPVAPEGWIILTPSNKPKPAHLLLRVSAIVAFDHHAGNSQSRVWVAGMATDYYHLVEESAAEILAKINADRR